MVAMRDDTPAPCLIHIVEHLRHVGARLLPIQLAVGAFRRVVFDGDAIQLVGEFDDDVVAFAGAGLQRVGLGQQVAQLLRTQERR